MMNIVALSWLFLSLVTAVVWTPESNQKTPVKTHEKPTVLVREGHRVFMIEYEREGVLDAANKATHDTIHTAAEVAKAAGENIRHAASQARDKAEVAGDQAVHVIKSGADKTKKAVKCTADKASHAVKDKASSLVHGSEKEMSRDEMVKNEESRVEAAKNKTLKSVGGYIQAAGDSLKDAAQKLSDTGTKGAEKIRDVKVETAEMFKENQDFVKENAKDFPDFAKDTPRETIEETAEVLSRTSQAEERKAGDLCGNVSGTVEKVKESVEDTFDSSKDNVFGAGLKVKDTVEDKVSGAGLKVKDTVEDKVSGNGQTVKEILKESYDSAKGKGSDVSGKIKDFAEKTPDSAKNFAYRAKDSVGFDRVGREEGDFRVQQALRRAGEAAIEKFRQAIDEAYRISTDGEALLKVRNEVERKIIPVFSEDAKDAKLNVEGGAIRTADLVKDTATNLSSGSSKGFRLTLIRIGRLMSRESLEVGARVLHLFAFSTIYGSSIWVNFLAGHVIANAVPRQQFGFIQSKMYPVYFKTMAVGLATSLLGHLALQPWKSGAKIQRWQDYNLLFSFALTLVNMLFLEPRATKAMFEKLKIEKEEGRGTDVADIRDNRSPNTGDEDDIKCKMVSVNRELKLLHRISSILNMLTLMSLTWHLVYLSSFIKC